MLINIVSSLLIDMVRSIYCTWLEDVLYHKYSWDDTSRIIKAREVRDWQLRRPFG
jgi:hypothetical protein